MKKSIAYLPKKHQRHLYSLVEWIVKAVPQTQMIILYGSYARNSYVEYDERVEFGIPTSYMSDYDILVVTHDTKPSKAIDQLDTIEDKYHKASEYRPPVQLIHEDLDQLNILLSEGRYFYTDIKREGVLLYNSGNFKLARRRKLKFDEIKQQAEEYYKDKFGRAQSFLRSSKHDYNDLDYRMAAFHLHQVCENLFIATRLVFTLQSKKQHNLAKLLGSVRKHSLGFGKLFPLHDKEEKRLFELLKAAYVEARYNPKFVVTKEDVEVLMNKAQQLFNLVERICKEQIAKYDALAMEE